MYLNWISMLSFYALRNIHMFIGRVKITKLYGAAPSLTNNISWMHDGIEICLPEVFLMVGVLFRNGCLFSKNKSD